MGLLSTGFAELCLLTRPQRPPYAVPAWFMLSEVEASVRTFAVALPSVQGSPPTTLRLANRPCLPQAGSTTRRQGTCTLWIFKERCYLAAAFLAHAGYTQHLQKIGGSVVKPACRQAGEALCSCLPVGRSNQVLWWQTVLCFEIANFL